MPQRDQPERNGDTMRTLITETAAVIGLVAILATLFLTLVGA